MNVGVFNRRTAGQLALLTWAVALAWLARREFGKTESETITEATVRLNPEANFFSVNAAGRQIGYASMTVDTLATGFRLTEVMALDIPEADSTRRVTRRTDVTLSRSLRLREFVRTVTGGGLFEEFTGVVDGDTVLRMAQRDSREHPAEEWVVPIPGNIILPEVLPYRLAFGKRLAVGQMVSANVLDLTTGTINRVEFAATAESTFVVADSAIEHRAGGGWHAITYDTVTAWRIEHQAPGTPVVNWVDRNGGLVFSEAALGVRLERSAFELVTINYREVLLAQGPKGSRNIPAVSSLLKSGIIPPRTATSGLYQIVSSPVERFLLPRVAWLAGGRQATRGDQVEVGVGRPGGRDSTKSDFLAPASVGRVRAAELSRVARSAIGEPPNDSATVTRLARWVAANVRRDTALDAPFLVGRVLAERRAGAEGMAALFVDLAQAVGLSARRVGGVAVIGGKVYGHTWAEVHLDGGWMAVDPTFGHVPASASLIRVTQNGVGRAIDMVPLLGSAQLRPAGNVTLR